MDEFDEIFGAEEFVSCLDLGDEDRDADAAIFKQNFYHCRIGQFYEF